MKALALLGSPRKGGNSDTLAEEFLKGAKEEGAETEKVYLDDFHIRPIGEVADTPAERVDTRADDDFLKVFEKFLAADVVCFASPVYWQGVTAQLKCFIDRFSAYAMKPQYRETIRGKVYAVIATFAGKGEGHWVLDSLRASVDFIGGKYAGEVSVQAREKGAVKSDAAAISAARALGRKAVSSMGKS